MKQEKEQDETQHSGMIDMKAERVGRRYANVWLFWHEQPVRTADMIIGSPTQ